MIDAWVTLDGLLLDLERMRWSSGRGGVGHPFTGALTIAIAPATPWSAVLSRRR
ncbi:hypothetical protein F8568_040500 [Actinomadura sp. LD22]|uniref:Uncharacterized protein n=1 Tax=Actinomadura physcomitrii TaxID=2650748 RepID=A0A6I4MW14_9ACTN|nr:hypothetical protein [Actinomadura physcomitrii]MWA06526.1 hypothetical protein [Actinomadura physcomitrii]